ncbi:NmrA family NAD(P)-binding protein, partial [Streptomyces sp. SID89]|nr:NmrA family NAD(P)-binding protein [Streptomyces sp. SID89]
MKPDLQTDTALGTATTAPRNNRKNRKNLTVAVLGATGMVGGRVSAEAAARGHRVLALSRRPARESRA